MKNFCFDRRLYIDHHQPPKLAEVPLSSVIVSDWWWHNLLQWQLIYDNLYFCWLWHITRHRARRPGYYTCINCGCICCCCDCYDNYWCCRGQLMHHFAFRTYYLKWSLCRKSIIIQSASVTHDSTAHLYLVMWFINTCVQVIVSITRLAMKRHTDTSSCFYRTVNSSFIYLLSIYSLICSFISNWICKRFIKHHFPSISMKTSA